MERGSLELQLDTGRLRLSIYAAGIVRAHYWHGPTPHPERGWTTLPEIELPSAQLQAEQRGEWLRFETSELRVEVHHRRGLLRVARPDGTLLSEDLELDLPARRLTKRLAPDERCFGFGEKTGPLDKRGRRMEMWNSDPLWPAPDYSTERDPLYQSIPFYISLRGGHASGLYLGNTSRSRFDVGATREDQLQLEADGGDLDCWLFNGPSMARVVERFTSVVGRAPLPPRWALGYHQCRWSYAPAAEVRAVVEGFRRRGLPLDGIWLDIDYMDGFRCFTWDPAGFPDPTGLVAELEDAGVKTTVILDPGIKHQPEGGYAVFDAGRDGDHFVRASDGTPYVGLVWPGEAVFPDFSRPATRAWWAGLVSRLLDSGVRGVWIDMNEPSTWTEGGFPLDARFDGEGAPCEQREARNVYALLMAQATRAGMQLAAPARRPLVLTRAGFAGIQRHAAVWTGDVMSTWEHLAMAPAMMMNLGLSGVAMVGTDVGGFFGDPGPELFARWMQLGTISPLFRAHVRAGAPRQEPWSFGAEVEAISAEQLALRYRLLPYLVSLMNDAHSSGAPLLRPLAYEHQDQPALHTVDDQLMLGPQLLAAPVLTAGASARALVLPDGTWCDYYSGQRHAGPARLELPAPLHRLPLLVRGNGVIPAWPSMEHVGQRAADPLYLDLYPSPSSPPVRCSLQLDDGESASTGPETCWSIAVELSASDDRVLVKLDGGAGRPEHETVWLRFHGAAARPESVSLDGAALPAQQAASGAVEAGPGRGRWSWDRSKLLLEIPVATSALGCVIEARYDVGAVGSRAVQVEWTLELVDALPADDQIEVGLALGSNPFERHQMDRVDAHRARLSLLLDEGRSARYRYLRAAGSEVEADQDGAPARARTRVVLGSVDAEMRVFDRVEAWAAIS